MKNSLFTKVVLLFLLVFLASCSGSGSGDSATVEGVSDKISADSLTLAWDAPLQGDGTPVADFAGYSVYYGTSPGNYERKIDNGKSTTCIIEGLNSGNYYLAVTCYDSAGNESPFSNEVSKTIQ